MFVNKDSSSLFFVACSFLPVALKILGNLHESVSFEFKDKNACGKLFVSSFKDMT